MAARVTASDTVIRLFKSMQVCEPGLYSRLIEARVFLARARKTRASINREYNPGWHTCMDLNNLMTVSEAVTRAAIERKESRGGQFRDDYPKKDNKNFGQVNTVVW